MKKLPHALILPTPTPTPPTLTVTNDIRGLKPPVEVPGGWAWLEWALAAVALAAALFWLWRRWRNRPQPAAPTIRIPPHVRAREKLEAALRLLSEPRLFCIAVSDALRNYLEERFDFRAPERTTEEFLVELRHSTLLAPDQKQVLEDFLRRCDLVKFARYEPPEVELRDLHRTAGRLVDETEPAPPRPGIDAPETEVSIASIAP